MPPLKFPASQDTGLRATLRFFRVSGVKHFGVHFNRKNAPFYASQTQMDYVNDQSSGIAFKTAQRWKGREQGNLWWTSNLQTLNKKKTIRSHCSRKLRAAFIDSLKEHGFDQHGWSLRGREHGALLGTLEMHPFISTLTSNYSQIKADTDRLVKWLEQQQLRPEIRHVKLGREGLANGQNANLRAGVKKGEAIGSRRAQGRQSPNTKPVKELTSTVRLSATPPEQSKVRVRKVKPKGRPTEYRNPFESSNSALANKSSETSSTSKSVS